METSCLYLFLNEQEIFAAQVCPHAGKGAVVEDSCRIPYSSLDDGAVAQGEAAGENQLSQSREVRPENQDVQEDQANQDGMAAAVAKIPKKMDLSSSSFAVVFFPTHWVSFRTLSLPFDTPRKIRQILDFELEGLLPNEEETHVTDFYSLGKHRDSFQIFTASMEESQVEGVVQAVKSLGLSVKMAAPMACGTAQGFLNSRLEQDHGLLVIREPNHLVFVLIWNRRVRAVRSRPYPRSSVAAMVKAHVQQMLAGACQEFGLEGDLPVFLCLDIPQDSETAQGLVSALTQMPGTARVEFCPDFEAWPISLDMDKSHAHMLQFIKTRHSGFFALRKYGTELGICGVFLGAILGIFLLGTIMENASYTRKIEDLDARARAIFLDTFPGVSRVQDPWLQMKANVGAALKKNGNGALPGNALTITEILSELSQKIDPSIDVIINRFLLRDGKLVLAGTTDDFNNVDNMKTLLESSSRFQKVDISSATADKEENRVNFRFIIEI